VAVDPQPPAPALDELVPARLGVALAHCLPECRLELQGNGESVVVGFCREAAMTPCAAYRAVAAARRIDPGLLADLLGLPAGCRVRARMAGEEVEDAHVGLGVYRFSNEDAWGFVFASTLPAGPLRAVVLDRSALALTAGDAERAAVVRAATWFAVPDELIGVTICFCELPPERAQLVTAAEALALEVAGACVVEEVT
jgi:hypothetical protein